VTNPHGQDLNYLLDHFGDRLKPDVAHVIAVSSDGLLVASTRNLPTDRADQLAAFAAGLTGMAGGIGQCLEAGPVLHNMLEFEHGALLSMAVTQPGRAHGASLLVVVNRPYTDLPRVSYEMTQLIDKVGHSITPEARGKRLLPT